MKIFFHICPDIVAMLPISWEKRKPTWLATFARSPFQAFKRWESTRRDMSMGTSGLVLRKIANNAFLEVSPRNILKLTWTPTVVSLNILVRSVGKNLPEEYTTPFIGRHIKREWGSLVSSALECLPNIPGTWSPTWGITTMRTSKNYLVTYVEEHSDVTRKGHCWIISKCTKIKGSSLVMSAPWSSTLWATWNFT